MGSTLTMDRLLGEADGPDMDYVGPRVLKLPFVAFDLLLALTFGQKPIVGIGRKGYCLGDHQSDQSCEQRSI